MVLIDSVLPDYTLEGLVSSNRSGRQKQDNVGRCCVLGVAVLIVHRYVLVIVVEDQSHGRSVGSQLFVGHSSPIDVGAGQFRIRRVVADSGAHIHRSSIIAARFVLVKQLKSKRRTAGHSIRRQRHH